MKKRYKILLGLLGAVVLYKGYHYWLYTPRENKHPKYFVTISGKIDRAALPADFDYKIWVQYFTTKQRCLETVNWFEGADAPKTYESYYHPSIEKNGHYQIKIPIDHVTAGYCDWRPAGVVVSFQPKKISAHRYDYALALLYCKPFVSSEDIMSDMSSVCSRHFDSKLLWVECDKQHCAFKKHVLTEQALAPNRNYTYQINVEEKS